MDPCLGGAQAGFYGCPSITAQSLPGQPRLEAMLTSWMGLLTCFPDGDGGRMSSKTAWIPWPAFLVGWGQGLSSETEEGYCLVSLCGKGHKMGSMTKSFYWLGTQIGQICQPSSLARQGHRLSCANGRVASWHLLCATTSRNAVYQD